MNKFIAIAGLSLLLISNAWAQDHKPKVEMTEPDLNGAMEATAEHGRALIIVLYQNDNLDATFIAVKRPKDFECVAIQTEPDEQAYDTKMKGKTCSVHITNPSAHPIVVVFVAASKTKVNGKFSYKLSNTNT